MPSQAFKDQVAAGATRCPLERLTTIVSEMDALTTRNEADDCVLSILRAELITRDAPKCLFCKNKAIAKMNNLDMCEFDIASMLRAHVDGTDCTPTTFVLELYQVVKL